MSSPHMKRLSLEVGGRGGGREGGGGGELVGEKCY